MPPLPLRCRRFDFAAFTLRLLPLFTRFSPLPPPAATLLSCRQLIIVICHAAAPPHAEVERDMPYADRCFDYAATPLFRREFYAILMFV